ncbi:MAG: hypothetical protein NTX88_06660 [Candidatus Atribacteria bacterium]|nr:hypothetical protein [Candidatus Atribacteria bacterium]
MWKKLFILGVTIGFMLVLTGGAGAQQVYEFDVSLSQQERVDSLPVSPFITIVPDKGNFATYFVGDPIALNYQSMREGYISIFDFTPEGKARILKNNEPVPPGGKKSVNGVVAGPEGMERFLILLSSRVIPDRLLVEAMRNPTRIGSILGTGPALNRSLIQIVLERKRGLTILQFNVVPREILPGGKMKLQVLLTDENNNALVNRRIQWQVSQGVLDQYQTFTNTRGETGVWFDFPKITEEAPIQVQALFEGDTVYEGAQKQVVLNLGQGKITTVLQLTPQDFQTSSGEPMNFEAVLKDVNGQPIAGRNIVWRSNGGNWENEITRTDNQGHTRNRWVAPQVNTSTPIELRVFFKGVHNVLPSEGSSVGLVNGVSIFSDQGLFFLDFSDGRMNTNFDHVTYRGSVQPGG